MKPITARLAVLAGVLAAVLLTCTPASAHEERPVEPPDGTGSVPSYRAAEPDLLVCKSDRADFRRRIADFDPDLKARNLALFSRCQREGFRHLQEAVDAVEKPGTNIAILPGLYREEPSQPEPTGECANLDARDSSFGYQILSYEQQVQCPHNQNLVAIFGVESLQIEGTGAEPLDVVIDAEYRKLNAIRADLTNGIYFRNFTAQRTTFNSLYVLGADGFVIDDVLTRWNDEYGFLTFAVDHGLYKNCESYGNGDSGIYPGSASNINDGRGHDVPRYAVEVDSCVSHHNMVGYSGTAGDSVYVHDSEFHSNIAGASMDSLFPDHPGLPQNHARFERNLVHDNNADYYEHVRDGTCNKPPAERGYEDGVVCPQIGVQPGTGFIVAGGNTNIFEGNYVWGHDGAAFNLIGVPAFIRGESDRSKMFDTSHDNVFVDNTLGEMPSGERHPNGADVYWDGQGSGNCWQGDVTVTSPATATTCKGAAAPANGPDRLLAEPTKLAKLYVCSEYNASEQRLPAGCDWFGGGGFQRLETQIATGCAVILGLLGLALWARRLRGSAMAGLATVGLLVGLGLAVWGSFSDFAVWRPAIGFTLIGLWGVVAGMIVVPQKRAYGVATALLGLLAWAVAFDKTLLMIPEIPLAPSWFLGIYGLVWALWTAMAAARRPRDDGEDPDDDTAPAGEPERRPVPA